MLCERTAKIVVEEIKIQCPQLEGPCSWLNKKNVKM
jgi:hypothetical protein